MKELSQQEKKYLEIIKSLLYQEASYCGHMAIKADSETEEIELTNKADLCIEARDWIENYKF